MPKLYYKSGSNWVNALNIFYPVGAFYISNVSTSPGSLLGGTWAKVTNAAIRGATSTGYTGSDTHALTVSEMPSHNHHIERSTLKYPGNALSGQGNWVGTIDAAENTWIGYTGGGAAHTSVQRSYNCYVWYRTA